uniref:KIAA1614 n=1 Tax=Pelodiscus sinensis TaxID=13735 RepID=K7FQY6_PELSI
MQELPGNDLDWDSGISLPDSEGCRAFVPAPELELSPRHEQAKQLLQRARMKARTSPLRASHDILPAAAQARREAGGRAAPDLKGCALKDGEAQAGGNLSDSSSGESSCGQPRKRGPSPSRVRFEDESLRDAEVRYLERLHVRQKRVLDSVLQTLGQSPLLSKPDLADYVNGDFPREEHGGSRACREQQALGLARRGRCETAALSAEGKCRACGSYLGGSAANPRADARPDRALKHLPESHGATQEARGRTLGPRGSPLWILPSRQRVHTERIRETYIGAVTYIDEVDSTLDSTDNERNSSLKETLVPQEGQVSRASANGAEALSEGHRLPAAAGLAGTKDQGEVRPPSAPCPGSRNSSLKETLVPQEGQVSRASANGAEALSEGHRLPAAAGLAGTKDQGEAALAPMQGRYAHPPPPAQGHLSAPPEATVPSHRGALESSAPAPPPAPNVSQPRPATGISRHHATPGAPPGGGAASPVPSRRAVLTGSCPLPGHGPGSPEQPRDQVAQPAPPPSKPGSVPEEPRSQRSPRALAKAGLRALSTNNCNNTRATPQHGGQAAPSPGERARKGQEPPASWDENTAGAWQEAAQPAEMVALRSGAVALTCTLGHPSRSQLWSVHKSRANGFFHYPSFSKPQDAQGEPKKPSASPVSRKAGSSSALGLKKFFCTLSQSTKQKLGRFRCYSMEQLPPEVPPSPEARAEATACSDLKKAPSLQSLRLVSPFCQLRKASSVQNLHSLLGKADRSGSYLVGEPGDSQAADRKVGAPPRRSLSVEDIGAPDLVRTVGRVVEVFPDGTSQLELQRPPQGTFGFRVSSGNGRPDTGIYVQEMADASTAKLYAGLLGVGDEILEVNGAKVTRLGLAHLNELLSRADALSLRVLKQRPARR